MSLKLDTRAALPDPLRVLLADYPRVGWENHANFNGMVQFWLERHVMFRKLTQLLQDDARSMLDRNLEGAQYGQRLSRFGGMLLEQLHLHHQIEDTHFFPKLIGLEQRLETGFANLEADHHALDGILARFAEAANQALQHVEQDVALRDAAGDVLDEMAKLDHMLNRHLCDEEELIVPVILKNRFTM